VEPGRKEQRVPSCSGVPEIVKVKNKSKKGKGNEEKKRGKGGAVGSFENGIANCKVGPSEERGELPQIWGGRKKRHAW